MRERLTGLVEKAELAVASSSGVVPDETLGPLIDLLKTIRVRMSYPEEVLVVALAGGTGSGKSSLLNALAGEDLVDVGGIRPTTSAPAAVVPESVGSGFDGLLDHIGVVERHRHEGAPFCVVDLPDTDSVEVAHRHRVDQLLPLVDAIVWVTDPEKYRDARLHNDYLRPLSDQSNRFVVALNQIDRLDRDELEVVVADLGMALESDGIPKEVLFPIAASPPVGPPIGVDVLVERLASLGEGRQLVARKLVSDLRGATRALASAAGESVDFDARAAVALREATARLEERDPVSAATVLTALLDAIATEVGGPTGRELSRLAAHIPERVDRIGSEFRSHGGRSRLFRRRPSRFDGDTARSRLNEATIRPARAVLAKRAIALASIADLAVEVESVSRDLSH